LTNPDCSICITNPVSALTPSTLLCVSTADPYSSCNALTRDCNDPRIICPTRLDCDSCKSSSGCSWCISGNMGFTSSCVAATEGCPAQYVEDNFCNDQCYTHQTCADCQAGACVWCINTVFGRSACMRHCDTTTAPQSVVSSANCAASADPCSAYTNCQTCTGDPQCTYCDGVGRFDGSNPGKYCTSNLDCNNDPGCGVFEPCIANAITDTVQCPSSDPCSTYNDCNGCVGQTDIGKRCFWCQAPNSDRYCSSSCTNNGEIKVVSCAVFGPTTGGLPTGTSGQTGAPSTGSAGNNPSGWSPSGPVPPSDPTPPVPPGPVTPPGVGPSPGPSPGPSGTVPGPASSGTVNTFRWILLGILIKFLLFH